MAFEPTLYYERQEGRDSIPYLGLVPDINTSTLSGMGKIAYGALQVASPKLELFGGLKIVGKYVSGKVTATGAAIAQ